MKTYKVIYLPDLDSEVIENALNDQHDQGWGYVETIVLPAPSEEFNDCAYSIFRRMVGNKEE
jgi:hypothetical protein